MVASHSPRGQIIYSCHVEKQSQPMFERLPFLPDHRETDSELDETFFSVSFVVYFCFYGCVYDVEITQPNLDLEQDE